jgi:hypothetical protein
MLKLSGWPRLTWGRVARAALPGVGGRPLGVPVRPRGAGRGARRPACTVSRASVHHSSRPASAGGPLLSPPRSSPIGRESPGGPLSASARRVGPVRGATRGVTPRQACPRPGRPRAQLAFKDSMVRGILQFTPSIAFRYVLHRCESRDIRCRESFRYMYDRCWVGRSGRAPRGRGRGALRAVRCSLAPAGAGVVCPRPGGPRASR